MRRPYRGGGDDTSTRNTTASKWITGAQREEIWQSALRHQCDGHFEDIVLHFDASLPPAATICRGHNNTRSISSGIRQYDNLKPCALSSAVTLASFSFRI